MNLWVQLPPPLDASELVPRCEREGVTYLPGRFFGVNSSHSESLRLSFAGLPPDRIEAGIAVLGKVFRSELERVQDHAQFDSVPALV
jgi:2-aminoadipate transaminase